MSTIAILMSTYNGERFLTRQLQSLEAQSFDNWRLIASDDGSSDTTPMLLAGFRDKLGPARVDIRCGPRQGFVANFLSMACDRAILADYYAYCDQDDIWETDKLARALAWLEGVPATEPALWCGRTRLIDDEDRGIGYSALFAKALTFRNALVQSIAGGNTMVFNDAARELLMICGDRVRVPSHDWWLYLLTTAVGGQVRYDPHPAVRYRVHAANLVGSNLGFKNHAQRLRMLARGRFKHWSDLNTAALTIFRPHMTEANRALFDRFCHARNESNVIRRCIEFSRLGVYRQTLLGNLGLIAAVCANKI